MVIAVAGAYGQVGAKLVERGYAAIPIMPGSKRPGHKIAGAWVGMTDWQQRYAARLPTEIELEHWSQWDDAGVCVVTGPASRDLVGIDIDVDDAAIIAAINSVLPYTPARKAGAKGETLFFRAPGAPSRSFTEYGADGTIMRRLCDLIGPGRQSVLPPTNHPDTGQPYRWIGETPLQNIDPDDLPELPADIGDRIAEALAPFGYREIRPHTARVVDGMAEDADKPHRMLNNAAMANLGAWVPRLGLYKLKQANGGYRAVATWRASHTGRPLEKRAPNLKIHPSGIRDFHDGERSYTPLDLVVAASGCDLDTAFSSLAQWLGLAPDIDVQIELKPTHKVLDDGSLVDLETGEVTEPAPARTPPAAAEPDFADAIVRSPCLVGEIARWILFVARRPQPRIAVAAALAIVATAASRQMRTPTDSQVNLYLLVTARSGNGKDIAMAAVKSILSAAGLVEMIGPEGAASDVGLFDHANRHPASIMPIDEFGDFIAATSGQRAPPHTMKIMAGMRTLWDGGLIRTSHALTRHSVTLHYPCVSLICASTPGQFYDAVGNAQVLNGFINRFVLVHAAADAPRGGNDRSVRHVPEAIVRALQAIADRPGGMNAMRFRIGPAETPMTEEPYTVSWADDAARARWLEYEDYNLERMKGDQRLEAFAPRCAQNAVKIATVLAIAENIERPCVTSLHVDTGAALVEASLADMMGGYNDHVPETATAALATKALQRIRDRGGTMTRRSLLKSMHRAFKNVREVDDVMKLLAEAGEIIVAEKVPENGGLRIHTYHLAPRE